MEVDGSMGPLAQDNPLSSFDVISVQKVWRSKVESRLASEICM